MHARQSPITRAAGAGADPFKWLGPGALAMGTLDLVFASTFWAIKAGVPATRIFQSIAAGVLGESSFTGGPASATLGIILHYAIIAAMMLSYYLVARRVPQMVDRWLPFGALYGLWLYVAMTFIVVPLSAAGPGSRNALWMGLSVAMHVLIGIGCAWCARKALDD